MNAIPMYKNGRPNHEDVAVEAALSGTTINIENARQIDTYDFSGPETSAGYYATTYLTIPLKEQRKSK